jgi:coenzyme F420 hydrogenase subunit beta
VDYANVLSGVAVGYMGCAQWIIVRNQCGEALLKMLGAQLHATQPESGGNGEARERAYCQRGTYS